MSKSIIRRLIRQGGTGVKYVVDPEPAAELVLGPGPQGWRVTIHWPRCGPTKLNFESEQAARDWIDTASSDWIANHPK
ncbi:MAG TPA: hypothetical protein VM715_19555, partial [Candidatus Acidoferrum sp.]|nr:hypothetical protein [Candidatus Acidoferrum sp.]